MSGLADSIAGAVEYLTANPGGRVQVGSFRPEELSKCRVTVVGGVLLIFALALALKAGLLP